MKIIYSAIVVIIFNLGFLSAQSLYPPYYSKDMKVPEWVHEMMSEKPNVYKTQMLYRQYFNEHPFRKDNFTQYYKKWMRSVMYRCDENGFMLPETDFVFENSTARGGSGMWSSIGPFETMWEENNTPASWQVNVYCIDQSPSNPDILYCATEGGELYKSVNHGNNWFCVSRAYNMPSGEAIVIHPSNPDIVYYGGGGNIFKTTDGGNTWNVIYTLSGLEISSLLISNTNPNVVMAGGAKGLLRSTDGGANWTSLYSDRVWDLKFKPGDDNTVYMLKKNNALNIAQFFKSGDGGATFNLQSNGWYSGGANPQDGGGRIGVSPANVNVVYAHLIGQSKTGDNGFIGIWKSIDSGNSWTLPHGQIGAPYTCSDANSTATCPFPNITTIGPTGNYHQGYYNCDLVVSATDENKLLIGGCSLWRSNDGGASFSGVGGYSGQVQRVHPDIQDMLVRGNEVWVCSDGGINLSTDFMQTHQSKKYGISGSDYWGFDQGWNEDVMVGGRYHNGNAAMYSNYPSGTSLRLGGGEAATGYLNPGNNRFAYFSDISNLLVPKNISDAIGWQNNSNLYPNESYWSAEFSSMVFDPRCYNTVWMGKENKLYKSTDGGINYNVVYTVGTTANDWITWLDINRKNPNVMYFVHTKYSNNTSQLYRSSDGGNTWTATTMPAGYSRITVMQCSLTDPNTLWLAYRQASNGQKIYKSIDGGNTWVNLTTSTLNGEGIVSILPQAGTNDGIYIGTGKAVYYRNNDMSDWETYNSGLPFNVSILKLKPFYRDGKIRMASYGKGLWEAPLYEPVQTPVCDIIVDKLEAYCLGDTFYFDDFSTLLHSGAQWNWTFQNGTPASSSLRNPKVRFNATGKNLVTLTVTDINGNSATDTLSVFINPLSTTTISESFENGFPPNGWKVYSAPNGAPNWLHNTNVGGYGLSASCMHINNYYDDGQGSYDDIGAAVNMSNYLSAKLTFDVAYARYSGAYIDSLAVIVSTDCGLTFSELYKKGGTQLATAPDYSAGVFVPNNMQWRTDTVLLNAFTGINHVIIAFRNVAGYSQPIYIDNVNLSGVLNPVNASTILSKEIKLYPTLLQRSGNITVQLPVGENEARIEVYTIEGKLVLQQNITFDNPVISLPEQISTGIYNCRIIGNGYISNRKVVVGK